MKKIRKTVLIPAMLDFHFPLLRYAFCSDNYEAVILSEDNNITNIGLEFSHNDLCYPCVLIIGQMISALQSGKYDISNTMLLIPQAGDACRGSNYIHMIRKALRKAGYGNIPIISLNFKGLEEENQFIVSIGMVRRAVAGIMYSDLLMLLKNQIEPYEENKGETQSYLDKWLAYLSAEIVKGQKLSFLSMKKTFARIAYDFGQIQRKNIHLRKVGIVGELYIKYCHLGNWNLEGFLREHSCEYMVNGFSWYILYYIDTHLTEENIVVGSAYKLALKYLGSLQKSMVKAIRNLGFKCIDDYKTFKENAERVAPFGVRVADGWLISCEVANLIKTGFSKILCIQPFGCMPNHVCGKGMYPSLQRKFQNAQIVSVDYDSSGSEVNVRNRVQMLLDLDGFE